MPRNIILNCAAKCHTQKHAEFCPITRQPDSTPGPHPTHLDGHFLALPFAQIHIPKATPAYEPQELKGGLGLLRLYDDIPGLRAHTGTEANRR
eukprot:1157843-Pelagomonas_calceolata.AAC.7